VVHYTTLERFPLPLEVVEKLDYPALVSAEAASSFLALHRAPWNHWVQIVPGFYLRKMETDFTTLQLKEKYDVIYFDAFAPEKQPEMWSQEIFQRMYECLDNDGILVTYCAKGEVRRMLQRAGFIVERLPGPPQGKREILRARKKFP
jgi:tRNA U34 5-methylaminomethyl-2-thiouridine-forming methyltransferase MnmC